MPKLDDELEAELQQLYLDRVQIRDVAPVLRRGRHYRQRRSALGIAIVTVVVGVGLAAPWDNRPTTIDTSGDGAPALPAAPGGVSGEPTLDDVTILVLNASGRPGTASRITCELQGLGFDVAEAQNSMTGPVDSTVVFGLPGYEVAAQELADQLDSALTAAPAEPDDVLDPGVVERANAHVFVIAGSDRAGQGPDCPNELDLSIETSDILIVTEPLELSDGVTLLPAGALPAALPYLDAISSAANRQLIDNPDAGGPDVYYGRLERGSSNTAGDGVVVMAVRLYGVLVIPSCPVGADCAGPVPSIDTTFYDATTGQRVLQEQRGCGPSGCDIPEHLR